MNLQALFENRVFDMEYGEKSLDELHVSVIHESNTLLMLLENNDTIEFVTESSILDVVKKIGGKIVEFIKSVITFFKKLFKQGISFLTNNKKIAEAKLDKEIEELENNIEELESEIKETKSFNKSVENLEGKVKQLEEVVIKKKERLENIKNNNVEELIRESKAQAELTVYKDVTAISGTIDLLRKLFDVEVDKLLSDIEKGNDIDVEYEKNQILDTIHINSVRDLVPLINKTVIKEPKAKRPVNKIDYKIIEGYYSNGEIIIDGLEKMVEDINARSKNMVNGINKLRGEGNENVAGKLNTVVEFLFSLYHTFIMEFKKHVTSAYKQSVSIINQAY